MPDTPQPIEIKLEDGSVVKAATAEEAISIVGKMKTDTSAALKEERARREALEQQVATIQQQITESQRKPVPEGAFDNDRYWKLMNQDPVAAQNYLDGYRFGIRPEEVPQRFNYMNTQIERFSGESLAAQFLQQHYEDFPATPESAKDLRQRVEQLTQAGYPAQVDTLNIAYQQLVEEGKIKPLEQEPTKHEEPNPNLTGAGATLPDSEIQKAEQMNDQDLEKFLRSKGMIS